MNFNFLSFKSQQEQKENKEEPTRTEMFIETRKRKIGRTYKESNEDTLNKIVRTSNFNDLIFWMSRSVKAFKQDTQIRSS